MARQISENQAQSFTVFGGAYIPEHHTDNHGRYRDNSDALPRQTGVAGLWLVFYAVIAGIAIFNQSGAGTAVYVVSSVLN